MTRKLIDGGTVYEVGPAKELTPVNTVQAPPPVQPQKRKRVRDPKPSDVNMSDLIDKNLLILYRETRHLLRESVEHKLSKDSALCMRENIKLLLEIRKREKEVLDKISDEELAALIKDKASQ